MEKAETDLIRKNLNDQVIKYNAIKATKAALSSRTFNVRTVKSEPNDLINKIATNWFTQKELQK